MSSDDQIEPPKQLANKSPSVTALSSQTSHKDMVILTAGRGQIRQTNRCCAIGSILAAPEKNVTQEAAVTSKEKRQTDHETRTLPQGAAERRQQQQQHQAYFQDPDVAAHYYAQQAAGGQLLFRPHQQAKAVAASSAQEQVQDLPPEYLSLIQQLADHQKHVAPAKHAKHHSYEPQSTQAEQQPQYYQPQHQAQPQQAHHSSPQHNQIQYITEEEYAQILKQAQAQNHHAATQAQAQQQQQQQSQQQYTRPAGKQDLPKYRPTVQLLETGQEHGHAYSQPDPEQFRVQYKSIQPTGSVTPVSKPISAFSFEKELAKLVESNRPVAYHQAGAHRQAPHESARYVPQASAEYAYPPQNSHEHAPKQSIKAQYTAPFAQAYTGPKPNAAHLQVGPHKFAESPAQRYQFIAQEERAKAHAPQQYFAEVSPKHQATHSEEKTHAGAPSPKIQYYVPKEKNLQIYYPHQEKQAVEQHTPSHPMKIVEAPQLQHEKPSKQQQVHRQKTQYLPRDKQAEQSQYAAQKSKEVEGPSRSAIYVSQQTGVSPSPAPNSAEKQVAPQQQQSQQQHHKIPPKIDRPLTQEEFQALVDAGYSVVPVPVPVPVPISQYHAQQQAQQQRAAAAPSGRHGPVAQASRYHQHQIAAAENNPSQVITYLRPLHVDPFSAGIRGPNKAAP